MPKSKLQLLSFHESNRAETFQESKRGDRVRGKTTFDDEQGIKNLTQVFPGTV